MNDDALKRALRNLPVPPPGETAREKAAHRVRTAFANRRAETRPETVPWKPAGFALGGFCAALLILGGISLREHRQALSPSEGKLLAEMEALFPGQLDAVICHGNEVKLDLAREPSAVIPHGALQPLEVILREGKRTVRILGYSGKAFRVQLGGKSESLEPLLTAEGKVILAGETFVWSEEHPVSVAGYRVQARPLSL